MNDNKQTIGYFAKKVASDLDITTSSLRRWALELEKIGYEFERNDKDQRIYYERDINALKQLKELVNDSVPLVDALNVIKSRFSDTINATKTPSVYEEEMRFSRDELESIIDKAVKKAVEEDRELLIKTFETKLNDLIENRDRVLTKQLRDSLESTQLQIAAAHEELETEKKKPWWKKLLK